MRGYLRFASTCLFLGSALVSADERLLVVDSSADGSIQLVRVDPPGPPVTINRDRLKKPRGAMNKLLGNYEEALDDPGQGAEPALSPLEKMYCDVVRFLPESTDPVELRGQLLSRALAMRFSTCSLIDPDPDSVNACVKVICQE